ncbi:hypothetical protein M885DRAFT_496750 [Pelagophyceae sp. CCMP2097]|nr:hypothetical protein M885DRAFT_496750 [Pelagophyceae sp. CCMP2097]
MATVSAIERLANVVFGSSRAQERREAEAQLMTLRTPQCLGDLIGVFDQSTSTYALMISATAIAAIIGKLDSDQRLSTRNYMLNYLLTSGPALDGAVLNAVVSIVAKSTKIGWFDGDAAHRDVVEKCLVLFDASVELCSLTGVFPPSLAVSRLPPLTRMR